MREILFRGKTLDNNSWKYGYYVKQYGAEQIYLPDGTDMEYGFDYYHIIPETIGQYTGLTDKNGTRIFEGDILQFDYIGKNLGVNGKAAVLFENGKFGVLWGWHKEFVTLVGFSNTTLEVIGNIHDNPELLERGEENAQEKE
jgi:uncharacterized phage protein (TIGR01671 family)